MNLNKLNVTKRQKFHVTWVTAILLYFLADWIKDNSGLKCENCEYIELARLLANVSVLFTLAIFYGSIALYACDRWNKYNQWRENRENKNDHWNKPPENDTDKDTKGT